MRHYFDIRFAPIQPVLDELAGLRRSIRTVATRQSLSKAVEPTRKAAQSLTPTGKGPAIRNDGTPRPRLRETWIKRTLQFRDGDGYYAVVGSKGRSDGKRGSEAPHAHLVERGTVKRYRQVINGRMSWVMFDSGWRGLTLQAQRDATPKISSIRPHISAGLPGDYQNYLNDRWKRLSSGQRMDKRSTGAGPEVRMLMRAWGQTASQVEALFILNFSQKVMDKAARLSPAADYSLAE